MARCVLDASVLIAISLREPGIEAAIEVVASAHASTVNWSETLQKCAQRGLDPATVAEALLDLGVRLVDFTSADAEFATGLWMTTRALGLSLADRACLALGSRLSAPIYTTDRAWGTLPGEFQIQLLRP